MTLQEPVVAEFRSYTSDIQAHSHSFAQLVLPTRGSLELNISGRSGYVDRSRIAVIGTGERHAFSAHAVDNRFLVLDVAAQSSLSRTSAELLEMMAERRFAELTPAALHLIRYMEQITDQPMPRVFDDVHRLALWLDLLLEALSPKPPIVANSSAKALARAIAFIDRFYDHPITVSDIAQAAALGESRTYELFRQRLRKTPREYLSQVRLRHALALLTSDTHSIAEIAIRAGYVDQSSLTRHVRQRCGTTPAAYRRTATRARTGAETTSTLFGDSAKKSRPD